MKESEWIVSPKKLKENQNKVLEKEVIKKERNKQIYYIVLLVIVFTLVLMFIPLD